MTAPAAHDPAPTPELGQAIFAPYSVSDHPVPEYVDALLAHILSEFDRIYWNVFQQSSPLRTGNSYRPEQGVWGTEVCRLRDGTPVLPLPDGTEVRSFWWGDENAPEASLPNFEHAGVTIHWYKHPGRSMTTNTVQDPAAWVAWFDSALAAVRSAEPDLYAPPTTPDDDETAPADDAVDTNDLAAYYRQLAIDDPRRAKHWEKEARRAEEYGRRPAASGPDA